MTNSDNRTEPPGGGLNTDTVRMAVTRTLHRHGAAVPDPLTHAVRRNDPIDKGGGSMSGRYDGVKLFIGMPCYGFQVSMQTCNSLIELSKALNDAGVAHQMMFHGKDSLVTRARNYCTHACLRADFTHLMWIDADIGFRPADVLRLIDAQKPIIGGAYPGKGINWAAVREIAVANPLISPEDLERYASPLIVSRRFVDRRQREPAEVSQIGCGFLLIERSVFAKMDEAGLIGKSVDPMSGEETKKYWTTGPDENGIELSEDYYFCYLARQIGIKVYWLPDIRLTHVGAHAFRS